MLAFVAALVVAGAASAHRFNPARTLRLQLTGKSLEGLVTYKQPPGRGADLLLQIPSGLAPGEVPGKDVLQSLAQRLAPEALRGLHAQRAGKDDKPVPPQLVESNARALPGGGVEAAYLIRFAGVPVAGDTLTLSVESGLALAVELLAQTGLAVTLQRGLGKPIPGGVSLHPRPGAPCAVAIAAAPPPKGSTEGVIPHRQ